MSTLVLNPYQTLHHCKKCLGFEKCFSQGAAFVVVVAVIVVLAAHISLACKFCCFAIPFLAQCTQARQDVCLV